jgi:hypothetical protein
VHAAHIDRQPDLRSGFIRGFTLVNRLNCAPAFLSLAGFRRKKLARWLAKSAAERSRTLTEQKLRHFDAGVP